MRDPVRVSFFLYTRPATTETYTLSLHDALPIFRARTMTDARWITPQLPHALRLTLSRDRAWCRYLPTQFAGAHAEDRKSTRLNSSHVRISYAVFCLKKKRIHQPSRDSALGTASA